MRPEDDIQVRLTQTVRGLRENLPAMLGLRSLEAQMTRAKFLALVKQGFDESQDLELCET